jgi:photosystem I P700 chlorophyll a apoprotein A1
LYRAEQQERGAATTSWIWNLHSSAHDFECSTATDARFWIARKVFSSNLAHLALLFFFLCGLHFHGAYLSNVRNWNKDARHCVPSCMTLGGRKTFGGLPYQDILHSDCGGFFQGCHLTTGVFQLWRAEGMSAELDLKYATAGSLVLSIISLTAAYFHMHSISSSSDVRNESLSKWGWVASLSLVSHSTSVLLGLGSIAWAGHCIQIGVPICHMLDAGIDPSLIPSPQDLLHSKSQGLGLVREAGRGSRTETLLNPSTSSLFLGISSSHHLALGVVLIMAGILAQALRKSNVRTKATIRTHAELAIALLFLGMSSMIFAHHVNALPIYPYLSPDLASVLCLVYHHIIIAAFLIIGAAAHASIYGIRDYAVQTAGPGVFEVFNARCLVVGTLSYLGVALGLHSFGLYIHNDTLQALGRQEDMFQDNAISLKPVFAISGPQRSPHKAAFACLDVEVLCSHEKVVLMNLELGTADFMVHHIHAFTIHITLLICMKAFLYASGSRLLSSKLELGWIYPCDGPGRGGTCQISPYDHLYLAAFWAYNTISVVLFHYFWKMQSDVWGTCEKPKTNLATNLSFVSSKHLSAGDFSVQSSTINGWLRNFLWSQAAQVIQSYGTSISIFGLAFLLAHFVWAFSLMFLYSGRGYWQELIESIVWAHHKLKIINLGPSFVNYCCRIIHFIIYVAIRRWQVIATKRAYMFCRNMATYQEHRQFSI